MDNLATIFAALRDSLQVDLEVHAVQTAVTQGGRPGALLQSAAGRMITCAGGRRDHG